MGFCGEAVIMSGGIPPVELKYISTLSVACLPTRCLPGTNRIIFFFISIIWMYGFQRS